MLDLSRCKSIVETGEFVTLILSDSTMSEFILQDFATCNQAQIGADIHNGKTLFIGVIALVDAAPRTALHEPITNEAIAALSEIWCDNLVKRIEFLKNTTAHA